MGEVIKLWVGNKMETLGLERHGGEGGCASLVTETQSLRVLARPERKFHAESSELGLRLLMWSWER